MTSTSGPDPLAQTPLDLYAEYLLRRSRGEKVGIEDVCSARPDLAERVREMAREDEIGDGDGSVTASDARSSDPASAEEPAVGPVEMTPEILQRLEQRGSSAARYERRGEVARGGQGAVLRVWDRDLRRSLAMKVTLAGEQQLRASDTQTLGRFLEEAQVTAQLDHPGIVPVHELGLESDGRLFFTMRLVKGRDLKEIIELFHRDKAGGRGEAGWNLPRVVGVMLKVCEAMAYAHDKDVIHRDLKPKNVMVGRHGQVYVMDWGLARILGHADLHDLRLRDPDRTLTRVESERSSEAGDALLTMDGTVVGTPAYMSPEQAEGRTSAVDRRSDVYSAGAILYHVLIGHAPYIPPGVLVNARQVLWRVIEGPPPSLAKLAPSTPMELVAICEKAMERDPEKRYPDMAALAEDLRAFLEHRVVRAYETGALAEFKKWVVRNKALAATVLGAILVLVLGSTGTAVVLAGKNEDLDLARIEAERNEKAANVERANVLRLSAFQKLDGLRGEVDELWPAVPDRVESYVDWVQRAAELVSTLAHHRAQLAELRARALPYTEGERERDRATHPRLGELELLRKKQASLLAADAVRQGAQPAAFQLDLSSLPQDPIDLNDLACLLIGQTIGQTGGDNRSYTVDPKLRTIGRETEALALARLALERAGNDPDPDMYHTLAWALFINGLDEEAVLAAEDAVAMAGLLGWRVDSERLEESLERLRSAIDAARGEEGKRELAALDQTITALEQEVSERRTWSFSEEEEGWWHEQVAKLVSELEDFDQHVVRGISPEHGWGIERRLLFAREVEERTTTVASARRAWEQAIASIRDRSACPRYEGLEIRPQLGLLPLSRDATSGLWEFAHVQTGEAPRSDGSVDDETGLVFVLLPGGTFTMGAQNYDPAGTHFEPGAHLNESPPHRVTLSPFFLSKYEMTQGQWERSAGRNPAESTSLPGKTRPVYDVSWEDCVRVVAWLGLTLPTEAQWEYAARGGTDTIWWAGDDRNRLLGAVNLADLAAAYAEETWTAIQDWPELVDNYANDAPVRTFAPNPFGFYQIIGNVWEWCLDGFDKDFYRLSPTQDPVRLDSPSGMYVLRGGAFDQAAESARSARRHREPPTFKSDSIGVRPARALER